MTIKPSNTTPAQHMIPAYEHIDGAAALATALLLGAEASTSGEEEVIGATIYKVGVGKDNNKGHSLTSHGQAAVYWLQNHHPAVAKELGYVART